MYIHIYIYPWGAGGSVCAGSCWRPGPPFFRKPSIYLASAANSVETVWMRIISTRPSSRVPPLSPALACCLFQRHV